MVVSQVSLLVRIGAQVVELLETLVIHRGPRVVAVADVDQVLLPYCLPRRDVFRRGFGGQLPLGLVAPLGVEGSAPGGVVGGVGVGNPEEAATVHERRLRSACDLGEGGCYVLVAD